ncbi:MAG: CPBP family intramembrane metalloprotease [Solobacterium sp.]|nr:CPBP family intramembrane metalloprotease [Solobacterium sp.]
MSRKKFWFYLALVFGLSWGLWIIILPLLPLPLNTGLQITSAAAMYFPALSVLLTSLILKRQTNWRDILKLHVRGNGIYYIIAWLLPALLTILGGLIYFAVFPGEFDPRLTYVASMLAAQDTAAGITPLQLVLIQTAQAVTIAPVINSLLAVGEELGWRGYMVPELRKKYTPLQTHLLAGLIWGVWHTPINMLGHNYGLRYPGYPWGGILAMSVFCFSIGVIASRLFEKTGSIWPCALLHGAVNAISGLPILFQKPALIQGRHVLLGPAPNGFLAGLPMLLLALYILYRSGKEEQA